MTYIRTTRHIPYLVGYVLFLVISTSTLGQDKGTISVGFQSETQLYEQDEKIEANIPDERMGSNNYLKIDYAIENFTMGVRYEAYYPPLLGFPQGFEGQGIANRFASFKNDFLQVTVGNFYEQFGSGLILRAYEERQLGIDNSIDGVNIKIIPIEGLTLAGLSGNQRDFFEVGDGTIRGFDGTVQLDELVNFIKLPRIKLATSVVSKFQNYTGPDDDVKEVVNAFSGRASLQLTNIDFNLEYVEKDEDPTVTNGFNTARKGRAFLTNLSYFKKGFGITGTFRRLENMDFRSDREASLTDLWINYIPATTRQHGYLMPNIYPYATQLQGETGGQVDVSYTIPKKSLLGGKYGTRVNVNYSNYSKLKQDPTRSNGEFGTKFFEANDTTLYKDFNIELIRKISKKVKLNLSYIQLEYNRFEVEGVPSDNVKTNIGVIETLYKLPKRKSLRVELQHLSTEEDRKNWMGGVLEFSMAPKWSFFTFDQFNYGGDGRIHYYQFGFSYINSSSRVAMSYGRQRGGLICVGGVCRNVPSSTGFSLSVSSSITQ